MRFPNLPVNDLNDVTHDFEQLQIQGIFKDTVLGGALSGTLPNPTLATGTVLQLAVTGTTRKVAFGSATATFTASANTPYVTITHGLGTTPAAVSATTSATAGGRSDVFASVTTLGPTTFLAIAWLGNQATPVTSTCTIYWTAIG